MDLQLQTSAYVPYGDDNNSLQSEAAQSSSAIVPSSITTINTATSTNNSATIATPTIAPNLTIPAPCVAIGALGSGVGAGASSPVPHNGEMLKEQPAAQSPAQLDTTAVAGAAATTLVKQEGDVKQEQVLDGLQQCPTPTQLNGDVKVNGKDEGW